MTFSADLTACAALVQAADPDRFLSVMAAPVAARRVLFPIYALNVEIARAPWVTQESMIAEMRLQWWRDALSEIATGGPVRRHEVVTPLAEILTAELAAEADEMIAVRRWDIYSDPFEDEAHLDRYLDQSAGTLMWIAARSLGDADETALRDAGYAMGLANWFRAIPQLEARGRIPLLDGSLAGVQALAHIGLGRLNRAREVGFGRTVRPAVLAGWQSETILKQVIADPARVAAGKLGTSEARKRLNLMSKTLFGRI